MIDNYKGFKVLTNNMIHDCRAHKRLKIIEYNSRFMNRISKNQRRFMLEWCVRHYKCRNVYTADRKTLTWYLIHVAKEKDEVLDLYINLRFKNKRIKRRRLRALGHEYLHYSKVSFIVKMGRIWKKITDFLHIPTYEEQNGL